MITVAGLSPSLDITYVVDDLVLGRIHRPTAVVRCAGGKPLNLVRAASRLGADAWVVAVLGGATGDSLAVALGNEGVGVVRVDSPVESRTCVSIASVATGELTEVYPYADALPTGVWDSFRAALARVLGERPGWLAISGGAPRQLSADALAALVRLGHDAGCRVAVDTHGAALFGAVAARPELVKINRAEAAELLGVATSTDLRWLADAVRERTGGIVVLTDAEAGAFVVADDVAAIVDLPDVRGHYPVGSGDSFLGGLLAELDSGADLVTATRTAVAAGAANALVPGPGVFEASVVAQLQDRTGVR